MHRSSKHIPDQPTDSHTQRHTEHIIPKSDCLSASVCMPLHSSRHCTMSVPSSTTFGDNVPWEKLAADAKLAVASALDSHFAASIPQLDRATTPFGSHVHVTDNVRQLLSEPQTTALPRHGSSAELNPRSRRASADTRDTITYTPATHRISKAKKGKRVHACQFPGCPKVFTRAEHRR